MLVCRPAAHCWLSPVWNLALVPPQASLPHWTVLSDSSEAHCFLLKMDNNLTFPAWCLQMFRDGPAFFSQSSVLQRICLPLSIVLIAQSLFILGYFISEVKWSESHSVMSDSPRSQGLYSPWNSPGQNTGVGSLSLLQGIFPTPGIEPWSPKLQVDSLPAEPQGKPKNTGVGSLSLLQEVFPTQESNPGLLHCRRILFQLSYQGSQLHL